MKDLEGIRPGLADLLAQREAACRLTPDRALETLDDAQAFVDDRGMLTLTADCALPSLFGACHEEPYKPGGHGFASWPRTRWWWGGALAQRQGVHLLKIHRGKSLFLSPATIAIVAPLCREEQRRAEDGAYGEDAAELMDYLAASGPAPLDDVKRDLGWVAAALRRLRNRLESVGAIVSWSMETLAAQGGERETSELALFNQRFPDIEARPGGLAELVVAGVRAAVVARADEIPGWLTWRLSSRMIADLLAAGRLWEPQPGWVACVEA